MPFKVIIQMIENQNTESGKVPFYIKSICKCTDNR